jgi:23S rRNA pseudouridine1911/1915/1917 synthase
MDQFLVDAAGAKQRLDVFVLAQYPDSTRARIQQWVEAGRVLVNDRPAKSSLKLREGDRVTVDPVATPSLKAEPEAIPLVLLYEDDDVVVIDKPAGMVVHAGAGVTSGTLVNALLHRFQNLSSGTDEERPGIVHRLDRFTSGVILAARNDHAHQALALQFLERRVEKLYLALVHGEFLQKEGVIRKPIARDPGNRARMTARLREGRSAITNWKVLRQFRGYTLLEVRNGTGRTHQIRVHLASTGHPVVGDRLYGAPIEPPGMPPPERYFLHAHRIGFTHPTTGEKIVVESPLTADITAWMELLEAR